MLDFFEDILKKGFSCQDDRDQEGNLLGTKIIQSV